MTKFNCNKFKCDTVYSRHEVRDTRFCPEHQPDEVIGGAAVIF